MAPANLHHIINPIWYQEDYVSTYLYLVSRILLHLLASTKSFPSSELLFLCMSVHKCYNLAKNLNSLLLAKVKYVCREVYVVDGSHGAILRCPFEFIAILICFRIANIVCRSVDG